MSKAKEARSLVEFVKAKKRADCPVCALPDAIREQIVGASDKKIKRPEIVAWLNEECGYSIQAGDLEKHVNARHAA